LIAAIALFFLLFKIPFWLLSVTKLSSGRSMLGGLARAYIAAKTFGMVAGKTGGFGRAGGSLARGTRRPGGSGGGPGGSGAPAEPPWPPVPRLVPLPQEVTRRREQLATRLQHGHDAERARAARRSRQRSQAPEFLAASPQATVHDPAVTPAEPVPAMPPDFSGAPAPAPPPRVTQRARRAAGARPVFQPPGGPRRRGATPPSARPIRTAAIPAQLQFRPATSPPAASRPTPTVRRTPPSAPPPTPVFRPAQPEARLGDAYRRTPSAPPLTFRPATPPPPPEPPSARGGDAP
jgi:hypothetical protein